MKNPHVVSVLKFFCVDDLLAIANSPKWREFCAEQDVARDSLFFISDNLFCVISPKPKAAVEGVAKGILGFEFVNGYASCVMSKIVMQGE